MIHINIEYIYIYWNDDVNKFVPLNDINIDTNVLYTDNEYMHLTKKYACCICV